jgi:hypothetical protein
MVALAAPVPGDVSQRVTLLLDHVGFIKGAIRHVVPGGFQVEIAASDEDRAKLATRVAWLKRHRLRQAVDKRKSPRVLPRRPAATFFLGDEPHDCFVVDYATEGAGISARTRPPIGTPLTLGDISGEVIRHLDVGFAMKFDEVLALNTIEARMAGGRQPAQA